MDSLQTLYSLLWTGYSCLWLSMPPHCSSAVQNIEVSTGITALQALLQCCCSIPEFADVDVWTSPNNKAYVAFTVYLEQKGKPLMMLLDIVEVPKSHSGHNLTCAFIMVLEDFGVSKKVSLLNK
jgi:hypothetical protein